MSSRCKHAIYLSLDVGERRNGHELSLFDLKQCRNGALRSVDGGAIRAPFGWPAASALRPRYLNNGEELNVVLRGRARRRPEPGRSATPTPGHLRVRRDARVAVRVRVRGRDARAAARCTTRTPAARSGSPRSPTLCIAVQLDRDRVPVHERRLCAATRMNRAAIGGGTALEAQGRRHDRLAGRSRSSTARSWRAARRPTDLDNGEEIDALLRGHAGRQPEPG